MATKGIEIETINIAEDLRPLIDAIGEDAFGPQLMLFLERISGARHCAVFNLSGGSPREMTALSSDGTNRAHQAAVKYIESGAWRRDPSLSLAQERAKLHMPSLIRLDINSLEDENLRQQVYANLSEKILICGQLDFGPSAISILGSDYGLAFERDAVAALRAFSPYLLSVVGKHVSVVQQQARMSRGLTSLRQIEEILSEASEPLSLREQQVCARVLYGISSAGIAKDLGIGEETVQTYRKRAYQKLQIATQQELLLWYLNKCGTCRLRPPSFNLTSCADNGRPPNVHGWAMQNWSIAEPGS